MAVLKMQKVQLILLKKHKDQILQFLQNYEILDIRSIAQEAIEESEKLGEIEFQLAEIKSAIFFLESLNPVKKSFIETFIPERKEIKEEEFSQICKEFDCAGLIRNCKNFEIELSNRNNLIHELKHSINRLIPWRSLDLPLDHLTCTIRTCNYFGKIRNKDFQIFKEKVNKLTNAVQLEVVHKTKEFVYLIAIYLDQERKPLNDLILKSVFEPVTLPVSSRTPAQEIANLEDLLKKTYNDIEEILKNARENLQHLDQLKIIYDHVLDKKVKLLARQKLAATDYTLVISGWIKAEDFTKIKHELGKITSEFELYKIEHEKGEKPPVFIKNPRPLSPFELITKLYGTPSYTEFDPSIFLAFFFIFYFGICLGDFFYGLILTFFSIYFMKMYKLSEGGKKLFVLLAMGGGVSAIVGILTGSYLGFSPKEIPVFSQFLSSIQIIDPIKNPLTMLIFALTLGVIQILFGIFIHLLLKIKNKMYLEAIIDDGFWIFFLGSLVAWVVTSALSSPYALLTSRLSLVFAIALFLTQGRSEKGIIKKAIVGFLSLYKVSGYLGDTLSYSRLLALGMSTTIIGMVINILAGMLKSVPVLGIFLMILVMIIGHIFNIILGVLGAFIHSVRLQLVEFFGKFYEGGGLEFRPFKREAEYTIITPSISLGARR